MASEKKSRNSWYVHRAVKEDFELVQGFFGEHLIKEKSRQTSCACGKSEKTAIF